MRAFPKILELTFWSRFLQALCTCFHMVHTSLQSYCYVWFLVSFRGTCPIAHDVASTEDSWLLPACCKIYQKAMVRTQLAFNELNKGV